MDVNLRQTWRNPLANGHLGAAGEKTTRFRFRLALLHDTRGTGDHFVCVQNQGLIEKQGLKKR